MATDDSLARRVRELEDREAIHDLAKEYCNAVDDRDASKYGNLMAKNVVLIQFGGTNFRVGREVLDGVAIYPVGSVSSLPLESSNHRAQRERRQGHRERLGRDGDGRQDLCPRDPLYDDSVRGDGAWRFARRETAMYY